MELYKDAMDSDGIVQGKYGLFRTFPQSTVGSRMHWRSLIQHYAQAWISLPSFHN